MIRLRVAIVAAACAGAAAPARAQTPAGRVELGVGIQWTAGAGMGSVDANETAGDLSKLRLFSSTTELGAAAGVEARVGVRLSRRFDVEATGAYARPQLSVVAANDYEQAPGVTATERVQLFSISGAAVWRLPVSRLGERTTPFVTAGAGYARALHENDTLAAGGPQVYAGGGITRLLMTRDRRMKALGVRGDARAIVRPKAIAVDDRVHTSIALTASLFVRF